jgi:hypothetical protein
MHLGRETKLQKLADEPGDRLAHDDDAPVAGVQALMGGIGGGVGSVGGGSGNGSGTGPGTGRGSGSGSGDGGCGIGAMETPLIVRRQFPAAIEAGPRIASANRLSMIDLEKGACAWP